MPALNNLIIYSIAFISLFIASFTDLKSREVPDWLNYGMIGVGLGLNLLFSVIYWEISFIINSLIGLTVLFGIAWLMFYTGQWGGGDSKIIMGLGALIGINIFSGEFPFLGNFFVNVLFVGALYGIFWSIYLAIKNREKFFKYSKGLLISKKIKEVKKWVLITFIILGILIIFIPHYSSKIILIYLAIIVVFSFYAWVFIKSVEKSCMESYVDPKVLTEGDWIAKDVKFKGKVIAGPKDLGVEKKQIRQLIKLYKENKIKKVLLKVGIPFVPSFFIAFVITLIYGNLIFLVI